MSSKKVTAYVLASFILAGLCIGVFAFLIQTTTPQSALRPLQTTGQIIPKISAPPFGTLAALAQESRGQPPIVHCGNTGQAACNLCDLYVLARKIIGFLLFQLALPIAVVVALIGGILLLVSAGDPKKLEQGKSALTNAVIGIIIAFAAWLIVNTILTTLVFDVPFSSGRMPWSEIPICQAPIQAPAPIGGTGTGEYCVSTDTAHTDLSGSCSKIDPQVCRDRGGIPRQNRPSDCVLLIGYCANDPTGRFGTCDSGVNCQECTTAGGQCTENKPPPCAGTCTPVTSGPCSVASLSGGCFGSNANNASQICAGESSGDTTKGSKEDKTISPCPPGTPPGSFSQTNCSYSWGLFQINLRAHDMSGLNCSPTDKAVGGPRAAFKNVAGAWAIDDPALFIACVKEAQKESVNIAKACNLSGNGTNFRRDWDAVSRGCGIP